MTLDQQRYEHAEIIPGRSLTRSKAPGRFYSIESGCPLFSEGGNGSKIYVGRTIPMLDMVCALGAMVLGYGDKDSGTPLVLSPSVYSLPTEFEAYAAHTIQHYVAPWATRVRFVKTGSEATHAAYRIAKAATGRKHVLVGDWCYDAQTELLTVSGWKRFAQLVLGERVATMNPETGVMEFQPVQEINIQPYDGPMVKFSGRGLDLLVSPNHRILREFKSARGESVWKFSRAADLMKRKKRTVMRRTARWDGGVSAEVFEIALARDTETRRGVGHPTKGACRFDAMVFAKFLGFYLAEGYRLKRKRPAYEIVLCQNHGAVYEEIVRVVSALGFTPRRSARHVSFNSKELWLWLEAVGDSAKNKRVPRVAMEWAAPRLCVMLAAMIDGDGSICRKQRRYYTASAGLADDVQEIAAKCGLAATIRSVKQKPRQIAEKRTESVGVMYHVSLCDRRWTVSTDRPESVPYQGMIYCARVENGTLYVRRSGKPVWSGNSYHGWHEWCDDKTFPFTHRFAHANMANPLTGIDLDPRQDIAAVFVEPHRWEPTDVDALGWLRTWCDLNGILLVFDEMIYGCRWAMGGATEYFGVQPDLACYGKAIANGEPLACVVGGEPLEKFGEIPSGTYSGHVAALAACCRSVKIMAEMRGIETLWRRGKQLRRGLNAVVTELGLSDRVFVEGAGDVHLRLRFKLDGLKKIFSAEMARREVLWHPDVVNVSVAHSEMDIEYAVVSTEESLRTMMKDGVL